MRCVLGPRVKSIECVIWLMSATAVLFLVYSLGKLQAQYLMENSAVANQHHNEGRRVLSLVKLYEKMGQSAAGTAAAGRNDQVQNEAVFDRNVERGGSEKRINAMLKGITQYVPEKFASDTPDGIHHELDELDGYNYFMVSEEESKLGEVRPPQDTLVQQHNLNDVLLNKRNGWRDKPPNVEFHDEIKQNFRETAQNNEALPLDAGDDGGNDKERVKFLYIDEHGTKVYGMKDKRIKRKAVGFQPLIIQVERSEDRGNRHQAQNMDSIKVEETNKIPVGNTGSKNGGATGIRRNQPDFHIAESNKSVSQVIRDRVKQDAEMRIAKKTAEVPEHNRMLKLYITTNGRLGNHLFQYAALYGIARATNRLPILPPGTEIPEMFIKSKYSIQEGLAPHHITMVHERNSGIFTPTFYELPSEDVLVCCYLQSWRYFYSYRTMIRHLFRFRRSIREKAATLLEDARQQYIRKNSHLHGTHVPKFTYVGVHVRRGDYMLKEHLKRGYKPAPHSYLRKAMSHFRLHHPNVMFVVSSDDLRWSALHLNLSDVTFVTGNDQGVDLAMLASCNHTIMTVGTYGWWASWLAGGQVTYYKDWIIPGSEIASSYNNVDYFPPEWYGIGDS